MSIVPEPQKQWQSTPFGSAMRFRTALRLAIAETRRSRGTLFFCVLSVAIGVMALTAVGTVSQGMRDMLSGQARQVLGADVVLRGNQPLSSDVPARLVADLVSNGARVAEATRFYSMLSRLEKQAAGASTQFVNVYAVGDNFPFYGTVETLPPRQWDQLKATGGVLLDPAAMRALRLKPGDRVQLGKLETRVLGEVKKQAGSITAEFSMAPLLYIHQGQLEATGLIQTGSRIRYEQAFALPPRVAAESWKDAHWQESVDANVRITTSAEAGSNLQRFLSRLSKFLTVVGLVTLFLGALGIGSALHSFMTSRLDHAAILRCLGARSRDLFLIYALVALGIALAGSVLGAAVGGLLPALLSQSVNALAADLLPMELPVNFSAVAVLHGLAAGVVAALAFTLTPIWRTAAVSPLRVLRRDAAGLRGARGKSEYAGIVGIAVAGLGAFAVSASQTDSVQTGLVFTLAIAASLSVLLLLSRAVILAARYVGPRLRSFHLRQGLANLHRPGNQTGAVVVAVGLGFVLLGAILTIQTSLERMLAVEEQVELPNLFVVDIQPEQLDSVHAVLKAHGARQVHSSPMISARIWSVNDKQIDKTRVPRDERQNNWEDRMRTREYFLSHRDHLLDSEEIVSGTFWRGRPQEQEASISEDLAENLGIHVGDKLTLGVEGLPVTAKVTSLRKVHWERMRENVMILLSPGEIEAAPHMYIATGRIDAEDTRLEFQSTVVGLYANLTVVDVTQATRTVRLILGRVGIVFRVLGLVAVFTGAMVLAGAIAAARFARRREAMLLKVLGASPKDLRGILTAEYASLAALGTLAGWALIEVMARVGVPAMFETPVHMPYAVLLLVGFLGIALNVGIGLLVGRQVTVQRPLDVLRES